jgi:zinc D-Ala-D-Ala carboxypeptidase
MQNIPLSDNYTLFDLCKSETAIRNNIHNIPTDNEILTNLSSLAVEVIERIKSHYGNPPKINSAYRCLKLNRMLGSKDSSQHTKGQAVDIEVVGVDNYDLAVWASKNLLFDQIILEFYTGEPTSGWVHCSHVRGNNRYQTLTTPDGKSYREGLIQGY